MDAREQKAKIFHFYLFTLSNRLGKKFLQLQR